MSSVSRASGLGKRYSHRWALENCIIEIPAGRVVGLEDVVLEYMRQAQQADTSRKQLVEVQQ